MNRITAALWGAPSALLMVLAGCGSGGDAPTSTTRTAVTHDPSDPGYAGKILLRDAAGNPITKTSTTPYNPKATCGTAGCHGPTWSQITNAYHFSQGRTKANGTINISDNYSAKPWVMSDGMYGKW